MNYGIEYDRILTPSLACEYAASLPGRYFRPANIQANVVHIFHGGASLVVSESAGSLSSAFLHQALLHDLFIQTIRPQHPIAPHGPVLELPVRRPAARTRRSFWGVVAAPKSYRARVGTDLCSNFNEVAFRVTHHRFVVSVSSYPRTSSYGHSGCAHGSH
jgi:hypothetical protein